MKSFSPVYSMLTSMLILILLAPTSCHQQAWMISSFQNSIVIRPWHGHLLLEEAVMTMCMGFMSIVLEIYLPQVNSTAPLILTHWELMNSRPPMTMPFSSSSMVTVLLVKPLPWVIQGKTKLLHWWPLTMPFPFHTPILKRKMLTSILIVL